MGVWTTIRQVRCNRKSPGMRRHRSTTPAPVRRPPTLDQARKPRLAAAWRRARNTLPAPARDQADRGQVRRAVALVDVTEHRRRATMGEERIPWRSWRRAWCGAASDAMRESAARDARPIAERRRTGTGGTDAVCSRGDPSLAERFLRVGRFTRHGDVVVGENDGAKAMDPSLLRS